MDIISMKRANGFLYAYRAGQFLVWNDEQHAWKKSNLMAQKYALNHEADKLLTPEDFLTDPAVFSKQDAAELPKDIVAALERAQPCQNAPIEPVKETAVTPAVVPEEKPAVPDNAPAFDYSGLDTQTVDTLHMAENQYTQGKKMAETGLRWMVNAVAMAHDALCGAVVPQWDNGKFAPKDDTFRAWCASLDISKSSAYRLLSVSEKFGNIQLDGKSILDVQPATLLYEAAKPSAPEEMVEQVKSGDITTHKQYQKALAQIKAEKERADAAEAERDKLLGVQNRAVWAERHIQDAEAQRDAALANAKSLEERATAAEAREEEARQAAHDYHEKYEEAAAMRATLLDQQGAYIADIIGLKKRAESAEDALKHQPITGVVDEEEVDRRAHQQAYSIAADMTEELKAEKAQLQKEVDTLRKSSAQLERRMKAMSTQMDDLGQTDFDTANYFANAVLSLWNSCRGSYSRLTGEDLESTFQYICKALNDIREEAARLCRQPDGYEGGTAR